MSSFSLNFVAEFLLADSNLVGLFFDRVLFFGRPAVAAVGAVGMGLVAVPYALSLRR